MARYMNEAFSSVRNQYLMRLVSQGGDLEAEANRCLPIRARVSVQIEARHLYKSPVVSYARWALVLIVRRVLRCGALQ
eukprot:7034473-Pyramimonas_sp.AAC.1